MQPESMTIWWLKKDFRLADNPALTAALADGNSVLPIFIIEPSAVDSATAPETSAFHVAAWLEAIKDLKRTLSDAGGDLCVLHGEVIELFDELKKRISFSKVISHQEIGTLRTFDRDKTFKSWCKSNNVVWEEHRQTGVFRGLKNRDHRTQAWNQWMHAKPLPVPSREDLKRTVVTTAVRQLQTESAKQATLKSFGFEMNDVSRKLRQSVSESQARKTLDSFLNQRGIAYSGGISSPNSAFTAGSRLSVHLAWGTLSSREVYDLANQKMRELKHSGRPDAGTWRRSINSFLSRLHWRDHFTQRLETEPTMELHSLNRAYDRMATTRNHREYLTAWCEGRTGFPLVDACIRCAQTMGFLNFRMRSMITSMACHALRLRWQEIIWPMAAWWADYEPGIHLSQVQMQAGVVGINTLRIYNPAKQIADHDPQAKFIKRWLPELERYSVDQIVAHQDEPISEYPPPIVDWKISTNSMRTEYYQLRSEPETKALAVDVLAKHGSRKRAASRRKTKPSKKKTNSPKKQRKANQDNQMLLNFGTGDQSAD